MKTFYSGGTLGDAYIIACKLYDYHKRTGKRIKLFRYTCHHGLDSIVSQLFEYFPFIQDHTIHCKGIEDVCDRLEKISKIHPIINSNADGKAPEGYPFEKDPDCIRMEPFPKLDIPKYSRGEKKRVGIQIQSGSHGGRGFSIRWIRKVLRYLSGREYEVVLMGHNYDQKEKIRGLMETYKFSDYVNKGDFDDWLSLIKSCDYFVSFEGFASFFAMSQKVKTLMFNQYRYPIAAIHEEWLTHSLVVELNKNKYINRMRYELYTGR